MKHMGLRAAPQNHDQLLKPSFGMLLKEVFYFLKNPVYQVDGNTDFKYRIRIFRYLLMYSLLFSFMLGVLVVLLEMGFALDLGQHAVEIFLSQYSPLLFFFVAVILAPLIEEFLFRGPLIFLKEIAVSLSCFI